MPPTPTTPKKCPCGAPIATWKESPIANKARMCKACADLYLSLGMLQQVKK